MSHDPADSDGLTADTSVHAVSETREETWNYAVFVVQGILTNASKRIGSEKLLMPYLYVATGAPVFLAGMLMPLVASARLVGQFASAPIINSARNRKWFLFWGWIATAAGLAGAALSAHLAIHWLVMLIFVLAALAMGFAKGMNALAFNDLISFNIGKERRNSGIFFMSAAAGVVTISIAWATHRLSSNSDKLDHYINLALSAALVTTLAGFMILLFREKPITPENETTPDAPREDLKTRFVAGYAKFVKVLRFDWFRQYLLMRCLTTTVILAMPFYAVHGATHHAHKHAAALSSFVIATSIAVIICGPLWKRLGQVSQRYTMAIGSATVGLAGIWTIVIDLTPTLQTVWAHSLVFAMAAAGIQAVNGSRMLFLIDAAPKPELTYFVSSSNTVSAVFALLLASGFGYIAQLQGVIWPVIFVAALNLIAALHALTLTQPHKGESANV